MPSWTNSFEASPAGDSSPSDGDDRIRELKSAIEERMRNEHTTHNDDYSNGTVEKDWLHKSGSASAYYQSEEPDTYPDGSTSLDSNAKGRLWVDEDNDKMYVYDGSGTWNPVTSIASFFTFSIQGIVYEATDVVPHLPIPSNLEVTSVYIRVREAPDGSALRVNIKKNGSDSIFDSPGYVEIPDGDYSGNTSNMDETNSSLSEGDYLTVDIDQVGSDDHGSDLVVMVVF